MIKYQTIYNRNSYNNLLRLRINNQDEIENLEKRLKWRHTLKNQVLLDEKKRYDQELKAELLFLDKKINELSGFKQE